MKRLLTKLLLVSCTLLASGALGCGTAPKLNVLLIVSDALRADVLSCYGGPAATPNICGIARRGALFEHAFSAAPWTLPSSVAIFTGQYPAVFRRTDDSEAEGKYYVVPPGETLLAERLRDRGYRVQGVFENGVALQAQALQGIELPRPGPRRVGEILERLGRLDPPLGFVERDERYRPLAWSLSALVAADEPFFQVHWIDDPHAPYRPPEPFLDRADASGLPRTLAYYTGLGHINRPTHGFRKLRAEVGKLSAEEIEFLRTLYRREVESVDERVGFLLEALRRSGAADHTVVIFTSDHGEAFGDHGEFLHGVALYTELVHVPLLIAGPGVEPGRRISRPVSHVDLVPTLAEWLGVDGFSGTPGRSLQGLLRGQPTARRRRLLFVASPDRLERESVIRGRYQLIGGTADQPPELCDYIADPGERDDLADRSPEVAASLQAGLAELHEAVGRLRAARAGDAPPEELERIRRETLDELRAVGYLD